MRSLSERRLDEAHVSRYDQPALLRDESIRNCGCVEAGYAVLRVVEARFGGLTNIEQFAIRMEPREDLLDRVMDAAATADTADAFRAQPDVQTCLSADWVGWMRTALVYLLKERFATVPEGVEARVSEPVDPNRLQDWVLLATEVQDLEEFVRRMEE